MRQKTSLRQTQRQEFNARFLTAVRMLQMPVPQLAAEIRDVLDANPLLEEIEPDHSACISDSPFGGATATATEFNSSQYLEHAAQMASSETLQQHLKIQLYTSGLAHSDHYVAEAVIGSLDERGYLAESVEEVTDILNKIHPTSIAQVKRVLKLIQGFKPSGVAARDLQECLMIQLGSTKSSAAQAIAVAIVERFLKELSNLDFEYIALELKCSLAQVHQAAELIRSLNPMPGSDFSAAAAPVVPDLVAQKVGRRWRVALNEEVLPKLRVATSFVQVLQRSSDPKNQTFLKRNLNRANTFLYDLKQRHETLLKVGGEIVSRQQAFFEGGEENMRPLALREIADSLELHESTISRACSGKYIMTPHGTIELKQLFSKRIRNRFGSDESAASTKRKLLQIVQLEDQQAPLSDQKITDKLQSQGLEIARRTVTKYRDEMRIPSARKRKALATYNLNSEEL